MINLSYKRSVFKKISVLPKKDRDLILQFLDNLEVCINPKALPNCKKLSGIKSLYRYRIGNYRIICDISEDNTIINVLVLDVGHRKDIYRNI